MYSNLKQNQLKLDQLCEQMKVENNLKDELISNLKLSHDSILICYENVLPESTHGSQSNSLDIDLSWVHTYSNIWKLKVNSNRVNSIVDLERLILMFRTCVLQVSRMLRTLVINAPASALSRHELLRSHLSCLDTPLVQFLRQFVAMATHLHCVGDHLLDLLSDLTSVYLEQQVLLLRWTLHNSPVATAVQQTTALLSNVDEIFTIVFPDSVEPRLDTCLKINSLNCSVAAPAAPLLRHILDCCRRMQNKLTSISFAAYVKFVLLYARAYKLYRQARLDAEIILEQARFLSPPSRSNETSRAYDQLGTLLLTSRRELDFKSNTRKMIECHILNVNGVIDVYRNLRALPSRDLKVQMPTEYVMKRKKISLVDINRLKRPRLMKSEPSYLPVKKEPEHENSGIDSSRSSQQTKTSEVSSYVSTSLFSPEEIRSLLSGNRVSSSVSAAEPSQASARQFSSSDNQKSKMRRNPEPRVTNTSPKPERRDSIRSPLANRSPNQFHTKAESNVLEITSQSNKMATKELKFHLTVSKLNSQLMDLSLFEKHMRQKLETKVDEAFNSIRNLEMSDKYCDRSAFNVIPPKSNEIPTDSRANKGKDELVSPDLQETAQLVTDDLSDKQQTVDLVRDNSAVIQETVELVTNYSSVIHQTEKLVTNDSDVIQQTEKLVTDNVAENLHTIEILTHKSTIIQETDELVKDDLTIIQETDEMVTNDLVDNQQNVELVTDDLPDNLQTVDLITDNSTVIHETVELVTENLQTAVLVTDDSTNDHQTEQSVTNDSTVVHDTEELVTDDQHTIDLETKDSTVVQDKETLVTDHSAVFRQTVELVTDNSAFSHKTDCLVTDGLTVIQQIEKSVTNYSAVVHNTEEFVIDDLADDQQMVELVLDDLAFIHKTEYLVTENLADIQQSADLVTDDSPIFYETGDLADNLQTVESVTNDIVDDQQTVELLTDESAIQETEEIVTNNSADNRLTDDLGDNLQTSEFVTHESTNSQNVEELITPVSVITQESDNLLTGNADIEQTVGLIIDDSTIIQETGEVETNNVLDNLHMQIVESVTDDIVDDQHTVELVTDESAFIQETENLSDAQQSVELVIDETAVIQEAKESVKDDLAVVHDTVELVTSDLADDEQTIELVTDDSVDDHQIVQLVTHESAVIQETNKVMLNNKAVIQHDSAAVHNTKELVADDEPRVELVQGDSGFIENPDDFITDHSDISQQTKELVSQNSGVIQQTKPFAKIVEIKMTNNVKSLTDVYFGNASEFNGTDTLEGGDNFETYVSVTENIKEINQNSKLSENTVISITGYSEDSSSSSDHSSASTNSTTSCDYTGVTTVQASGGSIYIASNDIEKTIDLLTSGEHLIVYREFETMYNCKPDLRLFLQRLETTMKHPSVNIYDIVCVDDRSYRSVLSSFVKDGERNFENDTWSSLMYFGDGNSKPTEEFTLHQITSFFYFHNYLNQVRFYQNITRRSNPRITLLSYMSYEPHCKCDHCLANTNHIEENCINFYMFYKDEILFEPLVMDKRYFEQEMKCLQNECPQKFARYLNRAKEMQKRALRIAMKKMSPDGEKIREEFLENCVQVFWKVFIGHSLETEYLPMSTSTSVASSDVATPSSMPTIDGIGTNVPSTPNMISSTHTTPPCKVEVGSPVVKKREKYKPLKKRKFDPISSPGCKKGRTKCNVEKTVRVETCDSLMDQGKVSSVSNIPKFVDKTPPVAVSTSASASGKNVTLATDTSNLIVPQQCDIRSADSSARSTSPDVIVSDLVQSASASCTIPANDTRIPESTRCCSQDSTAQCQSTRSDSSVLKEVQVCEDCRSTQKMSVEMANPWKRKRKHSREKKEEEMDQVNYVITGTSSDGSVLRFKKFEILNSTKCENT